MKIDDLIRELQNKKEEFGNIEVCIELGDCVSSVPYIYSSIYLDVRNADYVDPDDREKFGEILVLS